MSKKLHRTDPEVALGNRKVGSTPYSAAARRERSRELAQKRRTTYKSIMEDLTQALPFPKDVVSQLDYNSRLRLSLCFFRLKTLLANEHTEPEPNESSVASGGVDDRKTWSGRETKSSAVVRHKVSQPGMLQSMMAEALDGFLLVASSDGTIVYLSESVHHHLGIFQSEHIGVNMYDIISEEDHDTVREAVAKAETSVLSYGVKKNRGAQVEFFCRMKCSRFKVANTITKSPGFKVVHVSGSIKVMRGGHFLVTVVRPVSPPSILEIRMEANMFVTHYSMDQKCVFFDGRLKHLLGYQKSDLEGVMPHFFKHTGDTAATEKCLAGIVEKGEGLSGYYRFMTQRGCYVWLQSRGSLMYDSRTGKPTHLVSLNYIISKEDGDRDLELREAITTKTTCLSDSSTHSYDPFPVNSEVNPFPDDSEVDSTGNGSRLEELEMVVKEEFSLSKSGTDSGVHSKCPSLQSSSPSLQSGSHHGSSSTLLFSSTSSHNSPSSNYSDHGSNLSPSCLPDSTSNLLTSQPYTFSPGKSSPFGAEYVGQAPLGQTPLGGQEFLSEQFPSDQAQTCVGQALLEVSQSQTQSLVSLHSVPTTSYMQQNSGANMPIKLERDKGHYHGDVRQLQNSCVQEDGSAFQHGEPELHQHLRYGVATMADEYQGFYDTDTMATAEKSNIDAMTTAQITQSCPQASWYNVDTIVTSNMMNPQIYSTVTMEMAQGTRPQAPVTQFDPVSWPSANQSEVHNLLTLQNPVLCHDTMPAMLPNVSPNTDVWSEDMTTLPLLTDEDLDLFDLPLIK